MREQNKEYVMKHGILEQYNGNDEDVRIKFNHFLTQSIEPLF